MRNQPLKAQVEGDRLVISIGVETLAWACDPKNGGKLERATIDPNQVHEFAKDVAHEMCREDEIGNTPIAELLDSMAEKAADNGSASLYWKDDE